MYILGRESREILAGHGVCAPRYDNVQIVSESVHVNFYCFMLLFFIARLVCRKCMCIIVCACFIDCDVLVIDYWSPGTNVW